MAVWEGVEGGGGGVGGWVGEGEAGREGGGSVGFWLAGGNTGVVGAWREG